MLADAKIAADGLGRLLGWWQNYRDPIRAQAARVLAVFEAHGIACTQISRLLPDRFSIPMKNFASAEKLTEHLTPALLDWVAELFALNRAWLDGSAVAPHQTVGTYKYPKDFRAWLQERRSGEPFQFRLLVMKPSVKVIDPDSAEGVVLVVEERFAFLDDLPVCRYFLVDGSGPLDHYPVVLNLMSLCSVAAEASCLTKGLVVSAQVCNDVESGKTLIPSGLKESRRSWTPDALLFQPATGESEWLVRLRANVAAELKT